MNVLSFPEKALRQQRFSIDNEFYRGYQISINKRDDQYLGSVSLLNVNLLEVKMPNEEGLIQELRCFVDDHIHQRVSEHQNKKPSITEIANALLVGLPSVPVYEQSLCSYIWKSKKKTFLLETFPVNPQNPSTTSILLAFANLGRLLCDLLGYIPPTTMDGRDPFLAFLLAQENKRENYLNNGKPITLTLMDDFFNAIKALDRLPL